MDSAFFTTAAQVIPVLYLVIVFEQRIWDPKQPWPFFGIETCRWRDDDVLLVDDTWASGGRAQSAALASEPSASARLRWS